MKVYSNLSLYLGASTAGIIQLLSKDFLKLVLFALIIATPIAWYFLDGWLANYAHRIALKWWMFMVAGLGALLLAFMTISFQSIKAALANPIQALRSE